MLPLQDAPTHLFGDSAGTRNATLQLFQHSHDWREVKGPLGVRLPGGERRWAFTLDNIISPVEAQQLIYASEKQGYQLQGSDGLAEELESSLLICEDEELTKKLWQRFRPYVPRCWEGRHAVGLNPRLRFIRYDVNHHFRPHTDGIHKRVGENCESRLTVQLHLNQDFEGGYLRFVDDTFQDHVDIPARTGRAVVFQHDILNQITHVQTGRKYTVRTEVMYSQPSLRARILEALGLGDVPGRHDGFVELDLLGRTVAALVVTLFVIWILRSLG